MTRIEKPTSSSAYSVNLPQAQASKATAVPASTQSNPMVAVNPLAQPRQDVLAVDGKIYVETTPEQLLYEKRRLLAKQHQQPAWVHNLVNSVVIAGAFTAAGTAVSIGVDAIENSWKVATSGTRLKEQGVKFLTYFGASAVGLFLANTALQALNKNSNE